MDKQEEAIPKYLLILILYLMMNIQKFIFNYFIYLNGYTFLRLFRIKDCALSRGRLEPSETLISNEMIWILHAGNGFFKEAIFKICGSYVICKGRFVLGEIYLGF